MIIYLDFDGTIVEQMYPGIGRANYGCIEVIEKLQNARHTVILNTARVEDVNPEPLEAALKLVNVDYFMILKNGMDENTYIEPIGHTKEKKYPIKWDLELAKESGEIFIDDHAADIPLKLECMGSGKMVDWDELDRQFESAGMYIAPNSSFSMPAILLGPLIPPLIPSPVYPDFPNIENIVLGPSRYPPDFFLGEDINSIIENHLIQTIMESGIELIAKEREEQIFKHGRTIEKDVELNPHGQLTLAASELLMLSPDVPCFVPMGWDVEVWRKMYAKSYRDRLITAGALIAAEIDRLNALGE